MTEVSAEVSDADKCPLMSRFPRLFSVSAQPCLPRLGRSIVSQPQPHAKERT